MIKFLPVFAVIVLALTACSSTSEPENPGYTDTDAKNSFTLNGDGYSTATCAGFTADSANSATEFSGQGAIEITGRISNGDVLFTLSILVPSTTPGTYELNPSGGSSVSLATDDGGAKKTYFGIPSSGSVVITSWGPDRVTGTFECGAVTGASTVTLTSGTFDATLAP